MSLARYIPFDPDTDLLLRYGVLRQDDAVRRAAFQSALPVPHLLLPELFKPGVLAAMAASLQAMRRAPLPVVQAQRQHPLLNLMIWELASGTFLRVLEGLTGINHLLPDPYYSRGGWFGDGVQAPTVDDHPQWRLSPALVMDLVLADDAGEGLSLSFGDTTVRVPCGTAVLWQWRSAADAPAHRADAPLLALRSVYFRNPESPATQAQQP